MGHPARVRLLVLATLLVSASLAATATADPVPAATGALHTASYPTAGWLLLDVTVLPGGDVTVSLDGTGGVAPYFAAIYFLTPSGAVVAGGMGAFDDAGAHRTTFVDAGALDLEIDLLPMGEPHNKPDSPAASAHVTGAPNTPTSFRVLAYAGGAGNLTVDFTVTGRNVDVTKNQSGPATFLTEEELALAWAQADLPEGNALAVSAQGAVSAHIRNRLFGYFGVISGVNPDCVGTCVTDDTTTFLSASNGARTLSGGSLTFFGDLTGRWTFTNLAHAGVQQPLTQANAANCAEKACVQVDLTERPTLILLVADIPF